MMKIINAKFTALLLAFLFMFMLLFQAVSAQGEKNTNEKRYIVVLNNNVDIENELPDIALKHMLEVKHIYKFSIKGFSAVIPSNKLKALKNDPKVKFVEEDLQVHAAGQILPSGVDRIQADLNGTAKINGIDERVDVDIAILDSGIDTRHPDLNVAGGFNFTLGPSKKYTDDNGHGSHTAGIAAAIDNSTGVVGVAPGARLWAVKVLDSTGSGYISDVIAGIDWVTANASVIEVANMSLGAQGVSDALHQAIINSVSAGVFYAVSAGNESDDIYGSDGIYGTGDDHIPASYPEVAAISAFGDSDGMSGGTGPETSYSGYDLNNDGYNDGLDDSFASFSNYSRSVLAGNPVVSPGKAVDLILPGIDILSTYMKGMYAYMSGTSMASPHAAGLAALYYASMGTSDINKDGTVNQDDVYAVRQYLIDNGKPQTADEGLAVPNDPDIYCENLGWAEGPDPVITDNPPQVSWINPDDQETLSGNVTMQIFASDDNTDVSLLNVSWRIGENSWETAYYNSTTGYFEAGLDTNSYPDGSYDLETFASDGENISSTRSISVNINNSPAAVEENLYVYDITFMENAYGPFKSITVNVFVKADSDYDGIAEDSDNPVYGASVQMVLTCGDETWNYNGITDNTGKVSFTRKKAAPGTYKAEVASVSYGTSSYDPLLDVNNPAYHTLY